MQRKRMVFVMIAIAMAVTSSACQAQTDAGVSFYRTFTRSTTGNGTIQAPGDGYGGMFELRHISSPLIGFEISYGYNRANQSLSPETGNCSYFCTNPPYAVTANANDISINWVPSAKFGNLRAFGLLGVGFFITSPTSIQYDLNTIVRPAYLAGGGLDWDVASHLGLRVQFRENLYKAPDVAGIYPPTGAFTQSAEPMAGAYYRF